MSQAFDRISHGLYQMNITELTKIQFQIVNAICKDLEMQLVTPLENVLASPISLETNVTSVQQNITILMPIACLVNAMKMVQKMPIVTILAIVLAKRMWLEISVMHLNQDFMACLILYVIIEDNHV